jgi:integral membrane protein (TIGR00529 family)
MPMLSLIILLAVLILIGILTKLKVDIGISIFLSAVLLALLGGFTPIATIKTFAITLKEFETWNLIFIVVTITYFADLLKHSGFLEDIVKSYSAYLSPRIFIPLFAFIIGALPMPGGALVSAPLVEKGSDNLSLNNEQKSVINFWFRHIWEPSSPLYPEMILASVILAVPVTRIIEIQYPISIAMFVAGAIFLLPLIKNNPIKTSKVKVSAWGMLTSLIPILIVISLILFFHISIIIATLIGIAYIIIVKQTKIAVLKKSINTKLLIRLAFLMFAILYLKYIAIHGTIVSAVYTFLRSTGIPNFVVLFTIPFIVGILSGAGTAMVGVSYPMLFSLLKSPNLVPTHLFIAFLGGWTALMLTPTHLCLSLTIEYFNAKLEGTYSILIKCVATLVIVSIVFLYLIVK